MILPAAIALSLAVSCGKESVPEVENDHALMISPALLDMQVAVKTRGSNDTEYNENTVKRLDVFFFKEDNTLAKAYHITTEAGIVHYGGKEGYLLSKNWKDDGLARNTAYNVFVVANSTNETITTAAAGVTPASLQALTLTDENIYKRYATTDDATYSSTKAFLMNANVPSWSITTAGTQLVNDNTITLERAAVKFVLDVSLSAEFAERLQDSGQQYGQPSWKYVNFNTVTAEVPGGTTPEAAISTGGSGAFLSVVPGTGDQEGHYTVVTYAYPQAWTSTDAAPAIFLSFPARPLGAGNQGEPSYHYYYIPLCAQSTTATQRNNLYKVNAIINSFGSSEAITNDPVSLEYEVLPWGTSYEAGIEAVANDYILATPSRYTFKGGPVGEFLTTRIKYYASGNVEIDNSSISGFYIDKDGKQVDISSQLQTGDANSVFEVSRLNDGNRGEFEVKSKVPTNGTYREVHFTVKCGNKTQEVKIRHYPLDFLTSEQGDYSTYDYTGWVELGKRGTYVSSEINSNGYLRFRTSSGGVYDAMTYYNGYIYTLNQNGNRGTRDASLTNNRMYILQITSASDDYSVGRPTIIPTSSRVYTNNNNYETVNYDYSTDDVLSPAFMLGSQLGAVYTFSSHQAAAVHCHLYKEVNNGYSYTHWRLPTKAEIRYMIEKQDAYGDDVITTIVGGQYYWTLDGGYAYNSEGTGQSSPTGSKYVRCVRDLTAEELEEINKFE